jgi:hypothetical protein
MIYVTLYHSFLPFAYIDECFLDQFLLMQHIGQLIKCKEVQIDSKLSNASCKNFLRMFKLARFR